MLSGGLLEREKIPGNDPKSKGTGFLWAEIDKFTPKVQVTEDKKANRPKKTSEQNPQAAKTSTEIAPQSAAGH